MIKNNIFYSLMLSVVILSGSAMYAIADEIATPDHDASTVFLTLFDLTGFEWDIEDDGSIHDGTSDAYDGALELSIDGTRFPNTAAPPTEDGGRELVLGPASMSGLDVTRKVFVPTDDSFARFLEILENPTGSAIAATVFIQTDLGSDDDSELVATSSGDTIFNLLDDWLITDDDDNGGGDPSMVHVMSCRGATLEPSILFTEAIPAPVDGDGDEFIEYTFNVNVPANGRIILMHFASQNQDNTIAAASALHLANLQGSTLSGMNISELSDVVNFDCVIIVGGELLPIDSTSLLLAGLQTSAIWMLPVLAGAAGATAFYLKTRKN